MVLFFHHPPTSSYPSLPHSVKQTTKNMSEAHSNMPHAPYAIGEHIIPPPRATSPATAEFRLNHLMLRIKDPTQSLKFYCDCLGMHVVFIFNAGPWTIYYLGPRDVGTYEPYSLIYGVFHRSHSEIRCGRTVKSN